MSRSHPIRATALMIALSLVAMATAAAQQPVPKPAPAPATPAPGDPAATAPIDGRYLPGPDQPFGGRIAPNAMDSKPFWPATVVPPKGAPNVLLIMTDDVGYGAPSTFGGIIPTPALDRIAKSGLRYTQFHSTALCSPTRAALITGKNHHSVGFGVISEMATGYPGYDSFLGKEDATIGRILLDNGYATSWFGKDHNTPAFEASQAGPFDQWPLGMGFQYFYGFVGGDASQWEPNLYRNTTPIYPYVGHPGWNLTTAMADDAIEWMNQLNQLAPDKPFFVYYVPGGTHAPHHPTPEWIAKFKGKFHMGWNKLRDTIFANQKRLGVIPQDAELTPWPDSLLKRWDKLSPDEQKLFERQVEVYAAYLAYTDNEIGRVIQAVQDMGKLDNTIIVYISGDNGSSAEGSPNGTPSEIAQFNSVEVPVADQLKYFYDVWGSEKTYNHMAVGWTWAFDTPFKWTKQVASHFGGTRQGMTISWPGHITDVGGIRNQFSHVIDIVPTLLEVTGIAAPVMVDGVAQKPIEGTSLVYSFDKANANVATRHHTQYFEMFGNRGIYHDGWYANTTPISPPWLLGATPNPDVVNSYKWELYNVDKDWTQDHDLAASNPAKLKEMQDLFMMEAASHQVFPMDNSLAPRMVTPRPSITAGRSTFVYTRPMTGTPNGDSPLLLGSSYKIIAEITVPEGGGEGVIVTQGGRFGGWGFYLLKGKPVYTWNLLDLERVKWQAPQALSAGKHTLEFDLDYDGLGFATFAFNNMSGVGRSATGTLKVDGKVIETKKMAHTIPITLQWDENFDIGSDTGTPVDDQDYQVPFAFTGTLGKLTIDVMRPKLSPEDIRKLEQSMKGSNKSSE